MAALVIDVREEADIAKARRAAHAAAADLGMDKYQQAEVEISTSELATNLFRYACDGTVTIERVEREGRVGISITSRDTGPGIADLSLAIQEGYSTSGSMGSGLPGVKRMMDEFDIASEQGKGTVVVAIKWLK